MRAAIAGPALELSGCAKGQEAVAGFVTALKDIDGVTRVGVAVLGTSRRRARRRKRRRRIRLERRRVPHPQVHRQVRNRRRLRRRARRRRPKAKKRPRWRPGRSKRPARKANEMKLQMTSSNRAVVAVVALLALAVVFWMLVLSPKTRRSERARRAGEAAEDVAGAAPGRSGGRRSGEEGIPDRLPAPRRASARRYPAGDETASLLVQMNRIADGAGGKFVNIKLGTTGGGEEAAPAAAGSEAAPASPTEVAASLHAAGRDRRARRSRRDALRSHLRRRLLPDRRLHQGHRLAGRHEEGPGERRRPARDGRRLLAGSVTRQRLPGASGELLPDHLPDPAGRRPQRPEPRRGCPPRAKPRRRRRRSEGRDEKARRDRS